MTVGLYSILPQSDFSEIARFRVKTVDYEPVLMYNENIIIITTEDKMNAKIKIIAGALICASLLTGCAGNSTGTDSGTVSSDTTSAASSESSSLTSSEADDSSDASSEVSSIDESNLTEEQIYNNMVERSLMDLGNLERMSKLIEKLENKQEVTIAFIGGSITEGLTAGPEKCWAKLTYDRLCEKYPDTKINYVNAGLSGTPSVLGNIRLQRDVLDYDPDMVFVEFAVNDGNDQIYKDSYDAMVRKILSQEKQPAVALYFTVIKSGHTCEEYMSQVGKAYGLPMVSLNSVLSHEFETGRMKWEDYSDDESHPNEWGHKMTADLIMNMFDKATEKIKTMGDVTISPLPDEWVYSDRFADMTFIDRTHSSDKLKISSTGTFDTEKETLTSFPDGWSYKGKPSGCEPMEFEFTGKNLMLVYKCNNNVAFGSLQFTVDGEVFTTVATSATDGWGNPVATLCYTGAEGTHKVSIKPVTQSGDDKVTYVEILGFGVA